MNTSSTKYRDLTKEVSSKLATLRSDVPDVMKAFGDLARSATRDGVLDKKTKELIALTLGVASHCDACIGFHAQALVNLGATKGEVEEALGMAVYMGGGPSLMFRPTPLLHLRSFPAKAKESPALPRRTGTSKTQTNPKIRQGRLLAKRRQYPKRCWKIEATSRPHIPPGDLQLASLRHSDDSGTSRLKS